jgi:hypothetical protein
VLGAAVTVLDDMPPFNAFSTASPGTSAFHSLDLDRLEGDPSRRAEVPEKFVEDAFAIDVVAEPVAAAPSA